MDWTQFLTAQGGWAFSAILAAEVARRVLKGDLVLRSQYELIVKEADKATAKADAAVERQGALSEQTIASQADLIKLLRKEEAER